MSAPANTAGNPPGLAVVLVVTLLVQVLIAFAFTVPAVMAPQVAGDIGVAPESLGLYMLLTGIAAMVTSPFIGRCIHRFGAFRINQAGVTLVALSMLAGAVEVRKARSLGEEASKRSISLANSFCAA